MLFLQFQRMHTMELHFVVFVYVLVRADVYLDVWFSTEEMYSKCFEHLNFSYILKRWIQSWRGEWTQAHNLWAEQNSMYVCV